MNSKNQSPTRIKAERTSTAFRLPTKLLRVIDKWCAANDQTRSQFFRRSIMDRIKLLGIGSPTELSADQLKSPGGNSTTVIPNEEPRQWSPELFARLERRR